MERETDKTAMVTIFFMIVTVLKKRTWKQNYSFLVVMLDKFVLNSRTIVLYR